MFAEEMRAYEECRRKYDLLDGREVQEGGAARIREDAWASLLTEAEELCGKIQSMIARRATGERLENLNRSFSRKMRILTMYVFMLRASSSKIPKDNMSINRDGSLRVVVDFWKRTKKRGYTCEPRIKTCPTVGRSSMASHPRGRYLALMKYVIEWGGFTDLEGDIADQHKTITKTLEEVFGGPQQLARSIAVGRKATSHCCRKTAASAAFAAGLTSIGRLQKWGEWSRGNQGPGEAQYWGALRNYVDPDYEVSQFSKQMFDWLA